MKTGEKNTPTFGAHFKPCNRSKGEKENDFKYTEFVVRHSSVLTPENRGLSCYGMFTPQYRYSAALLRNFSAQYRIPES